MNRSIRTTAVYILNDFKRVYSKIYFDFSASTQKNFRAIDLIIRNIKLIKNFQANDFFDNNFIKNFSVITNKINIITTDTFIFSTRAIVFKFSILKIVSVIPRKALQVEKINQLNKSNIVSSVVNSVLFQVQFFNLDKKILVFSINQDN